MSQPSITCPKCHRTSYNANDIRTGYCGMCHDFTSNPDRVPVPSACPTCHELLDSATVVSEKERVKPSAGDFSLCIRCAEILVFNPDLTLRAAELNDFNGVTPETHRLLDRAQRLIRETRPVK
jgi:hypothetical protein